MLDEGTASRPTLEPAEDVDRIDAELATTSTSDYSTHHRGQARRAADTLRVAKQYLAPEKMVVVAVGDRAKIQPELEKLGLGPVEVRDVNGQAVAGSEKK